MIWTLSVLSSGESRRLSDTMISPGERVVADHREVERRVRVGDLHDRALARRLAFVRRDLPEAFDLRHAGPDRIVQDVAVDDRRFRSWTAPATGLSAGATGSRR